MNFLKDARIEFKIFWCTMPLIILLTAVGFYLVPEPWNWSIPVIAGIVCILFGSLVLYTRGGK